MPAWPPCAGRVCAKNEAAAGPNLKSPPVVYQKTPAAAECAAFEPDIIVLGPFGKHDAMSPIGWGKEAQKNGGYDNPAPFTSPSHSQLSGGSIYLLS